MSQWVGVWHGVAGSLLSLLAAMKVSATAVILSRLRVLYQAHLGNWQNSVPGGYRTADSPFVVCSQPEIILNS